MKPAFRRNFTVLAAALASAGLATGCGQRRAADARVEPPLPVRTQPVAARVFERRVSVQGTLEAKHFVQVAARVEGILDEIWVDKGDRVIGGETPLFQVDPIPRRHALAIAEQDLAVAEAGGRVARASVESARAEARKVELDYERFERLRRDDRVSAGEFETMDVARARARAAVAVAEAQAELAESRVRQAGAALEIARKHLADTRVIAPISGQVSARLAEPGERVAVGRIVLRIDDLSEIEAAAFLPAQYYADVQPGATEFRLTLDGHDAGRHTVEYRSPTIHTALRTFEIRGRVRAPDAVPGRMADLTLVFESREQLGVPSSAVLIRDGRPTVFVADAGHARARAVETGWQNDGWTEIRAGLAVGDRVVVEGQTQLRDGQAVEER